MQFHNKILNNKEYFMKNTEQVLIKGLQSPSENSINVFEKNKIQELKKRDQEIRNSESTKVSYEDQTSFWNFLNDTQMGKFDPSKLAKPNTWVITRNGTWLVQKNRGGYYAVRKNEIGIPTLPETKPLPTAFFDLTYGRIPNTILEQVVTFFREIMKRYNDAEAFVQIYWDKEENKYVCHVPKQQISKGSVNYDVSKNLDALNSERYVFVYECHSH